MAHRVQVEDDSLGLDLHPADELCRCASHHGEPEPAEHAHVQDSHPCAGDLLVVLQPAGEEQSIDGAFDEYVTRSLTSAASTSCKSTAPSDSGPLPL